MGSIKQFAGQTIVYGLGSVLSKLVYYLLVVVLLTYLLGGKEYEFGIYGELYGYVTVLIILFSLKLDTALFRFGNIKSNFQEAFDTTGTLVILSAIILIGIGFGFTEPLARLINYPDRPKYIQWFSLILAFDVVALIPFAKLRLQNKARVFAGLKIFNVAFSSVLILFFLVLYPKLQGRALVAWLPVFDYQIDYVILTNVISSALLLIILLFYTGRFRVRLSYALLKKIIPYVVPLIIVGMCNNFIQYNGAAVIKYLNSSELLLQNLSASGIFDSSRRIAGLFVIFIGAFNYAAEPFFFNNYKDEDRKSLYGKICHIFVLTGGLIILSLILGMDILKYLVGEGFRESLFIIPILLFAYLFLGIYHNLSIWYKLADKTTWGAVISVAGVLITLFISILFLPRYGYVVFAWANLVAYVVMSVLAYFSGQYYYPIKYPVRRIVFSSCIIAMIVALSIALKPHLDGLARYVTYFCLFSAYIMYAFYAEKEEWLLLFTRNKS